MDTANLIINWACIAVSIGTLAALGFTGGLGEKALQRGPTRDIDLSPPMRWLGIALMFGYVALMMGKDLLPHDDNPETPDDLYQTVSMLASLYPLMIIGLLIGRLPHVEGGFRKIGLLPRHPMRDLKWSAAGVPIAFAMASATFSLVMWLAGLFGYAPGEAVHDSLQALRDDPSQLGVIVFGAVVLAPLLEELTFRGVLQTCLMQQLGHRRWPAIVITAALFSVTHCWVVPWHALPTLFVLGLVFGYVYERTGSLLPPILIHAGFNAANIGIAIATTPPPPSIH